MFQMCLECVPDTSRTRFVRFPFWKKGVWHSHTSCCSFITRFYTCTDASRAGSGHVAHIPDASCMHFRPVAHTFEMRSNVALELSCTVVILEHADVPLCYTWPKLVITCFFFFLIFTNLTTPCHTLRPHKCECAWVWKADGGAQVPVGPVVAIPQLLVKLQKDVEVLPFKIVLISAVTADGNGFCITLAINFDLGS